MTVVPRAAARFARIPFDPARLPFYYGWVMVPGAISGLSMAIMVFASAIGPLLFSGVRDLTHSYHAILIAWCVVPLALAVASRWARAPQVPSVR